MKALNSADLLFLATVKKMRGETQILKDGDFYLNGYYFGKSWFSDRFYYLTESQMLVMPKPLKNAKEKLQRRLHDNRTGKQRRICGL